MGSGGINETLLYEIVGPTFLGYVLNVDASAIAAHFHGSALPAPRAEVLAELTLVLGQLLPDPSVDPLLRQLQLDALARYDATHRTSYAKTLRLRCGGSVDDIASDDPVIASITLMARDVYPLFLLPLPATHQ